MKSLLIILVTACVVMVKASTYTDRYDSMNVDDVIANRRLLIAYVKCVLEQGRCTPEGRELKSHITEALQSGCDKCTDRQRRSIKKVIKHLIHKENNYWKQLVDMYDHNKIYSKMYERELGSV